jgi:FkbM family methyltransferase
MNLASTFAHKIRYRLLTFIWKINCFVLGNRISRFTLLEGSKLDYPLNTIIGKLLWIDNFEKAELEYLISSLNTGDIFFDVGANGGIFTVIAAKRVGPTGHVYAFEPGIPELDTLRNNIQLNNLTNVTIVDVAVSNQSGTTKFAVSQDGAMNSMIQTNHPSQKIESWRNVSTITLDDFIKTKHIDRVDFLKVDVEGGEQLVFEGAHNLLADESKLTIMFEYSDATSSSFGCSIQGIIEDFHNREFDMNIVDPFLGVIPISSNISKKIETISTFNFVAIKNKK